MFDRVLSPHAGIIGIPIVRVNRHTDTEYRHAYGVDTIGQRLKHARKLRKMSQEVLARLAGVRQSSISELENGESKQPASDTLIALERALDIRAEWLIHNEGAMELDNDVEPEELTFSIRSNPVVGYVMAGDRGFFDELAYSTGHGDGVVLYPTKDQNTYALRVRGTSMQPRVNPGEYVVVMPNQPVKTNDEVVVRTIDGRVMVKRLGTRRAGVYELKSLNPAHPTIYVEEAQLEKMHYVGGFAKDDLYRSAL